MIEDTREAVGDRCAVAVRLAIDELHGNNGITSDGDGRRIIEYLGELPDLWDIALGGGLGNDSCSSRFSDEGYQEKYAGQVKSSTSKPVVSVGRFTSPDTMVSQIKRGVQDFIGAARPSIADPFLPHKINQGDEDRIRECIGCNICRSANNEASPLRCTQNPTMGEEWRRGWHPERIDAACNQDKFLVVGGGPAGLEATLALGRRRHQVTLTEAATELGGRLLRESTLPGLQNWIRVRDHRAYLISQMDNIDVYLDSPLDAADIAEFGADAVVIAAGSRWRRDALGATRRYPIEIAPEARLLTADDVFAGAELAEQLVIYDDEHYVMAGALAEQLLLAGHGVTYVTPATMVSSWTAMTDEQAFIQQRLLSLGLTTVFAHQVEKIESHSLVTACIYSQQLLQIEFDDLLLVTGRESVDGLFHDLGTDAYRIGDCLVPSSIADAVYSGHRFAREYGLPPQDLIPRRERAAFFESASRTRESA